jgi:hypothetical protein
VASDDGRDWIDEAMARGGTWDPPPDFPERVVLRAAAARALPVVRQRGLLSFDVAGFVRFLLSCGSDHILGRLEGSAWVVRQYWSLLLR